MTIAPGIGPLAIFAAVLGVLIVSSTPRPIGDGREYLAVADRLSRGGSPSLSRAEVDQFDIRGRILPAHDGRLETIHFWMYPALAAVPVALTHKMRLDPAVAFAAFNLLLLFGAAALAARRLHWSGFIVLFLSPIVWWADKVHTEALTFSLLTVALCALPGHPWVGAIALGVASAQNPPLAAILALAAAAMLLDGSAKIRALAAFGAGALIAALHPIYYWWRLGRMVPLAETTAATLSLQSFSAVLVDPNIGLTFNDPFLPLAGAATISIGWWCGWWKPGIWQVVAVAAAVVLLIIFGQVVNINHGGTPSMSRHAVWLMPLAVPFLPPRDGPSPGRLLPVLAVLGACWSIAYYRPSLQENFLAPTRASAWLWSRHPSWSNPVPEIFAERVRHRENVLPGPAATPDCAKILMWAGVGPPECPRMAVPVKCERGPCYANRRADNSYAFVTAP